MHPDLTARIRTGNIEDDFDRVAEADWIVEAVFEDLSIKRALYTKLEAIRKDGSIVSSNTSTIPLAALTKGQGERFARDFVVTHFFNPPRLMKLLEIVANDQTDPAVAARSMITCWASPTSNVSTHRVLLPIAWGITGCR